eukprot:CAMPEP_0176455568 /NCGR_PEP_ID=MMETSP0127-20121128/30705_1 /TAXON_ID=938130 /ORGANISM="Platyophrya macrostoma, Strain WH" /LENGTH=174 /DNA_ID=CAMNT_0017845231 /DNA_START=157 /DNA_END=682 /DNA_ORIENTATION=-
MTVGIDYKTKKIKVDGSEIKLQIWDTAGQEKYRSITQNFYKNAMGVIIVFDLTDEGTFDNVRNWIRQIKNHAGENVCRLLVGNKCDIEENKIPKEKIAEFVKEVDIEYFETSAKSNININEAFYSIAKDIKSKYLKGADELPPIEENGMRKTLGRDDKKKNEPTKDKSKAAANP